MDAFWPIILSLVCVAIGLLSERKKKNTATKNSNPHAPHFPVSSRIIPKIQAQATTSSPASSPLPLPQEGEHIVLPVPTASDVEALNKKQAENKALRKHYNFWRKAVVTQTILNKNRSI